MKSEIDEVVARSSWDFVGQLANLNDDLYIREAVMKLAIREVSWAMLDAFRDKYSLAEQLRCMADLVEDHETESAS